MATYRPATVDDSAVLARMARDRRRAAEAVARPGKTQVWQTTDKVAGASSAADAAQTKAEAAQSAADSAQTKAEAAQSAADSAQTKAEAAQSAADSAQTKAEAAQSAADSAQTKAEAAQSAADSAQTKAEAAKAKAEAATLPVGACVLMATKAAPGLAGTWSLVTGVKLPMTGSDATYYVYERTA